LHRLEIDAVRRRQMIEALRDTPRGRGGAPAALLVGQPRRHAMRIAFRRIQRPFDRGEIRRTV